MKRACSPTPDHSALPCPAMSWHGMAWQGTKINGMVAGEADSEIQAKRGGGGGGSFPAKSLGLCCPKYLMGIDTELSVSVAG